LEVMPSIPNNVATNYFELVISIKHKQEATIWFLEIILHHWVGEAWTLEIRSIHITNV